MPKFSERSLTKLKQAHTDLIILFSAAIKEYDFKIACGYRGREDQEKAFADGFSKAHFGTSPHNFVPALAVDAIPTKTEWSDIQALKDLGALVKAKAVELGIEITWGGDFKSFKDRPHYELKNWKKLAGIA